MSIRPFLACAAVSAALILQACAGRPSAAATVPATPTPTPAAPPARAVENPEDVRARMPLRPTPPQPESRFPPPQQSQEEEERNANMPAEPELLHVEPAVFLDGEPFPEKKPYEPGFPEAHRNRYVSANASGPGDGTFEHPWKDLQEALCSLEPGDRLVLSADIYTGSFRIAGACRSGTAERPIQVFARHAFLKPSGDGTVLTVERAHWQFWEVQFALTDSTAEGLVISGPEAHDIAVDQSHIYEGRGAAVHIAAGSSSITISNCHIHHSGGVRIDGGTRDVTLVNNHMHHNRTGSIRIGSGPGAEPARAVSIVGNRLNNDHGPALDLSNCRDLTVTRSRFSNYRAGDETAGEAVLVRSGCQGVRFEANSILEATVALRVGERSESGPAARTVVFQRNYLENSLTPESVGLWILRGEDVRFLNNVIDRYSEPLRISGSGVEKAAIANNLVIAPKIAFVLESPSAAAFFDYNVFGAARGLQAGVGTGRVDAASWMAARMPNSRIVPGANLSGGDLARIVGFSPRDGGKALDGLSFKGPAPDIGVAER